MINQILSFYLIAFIASVCMLLIHYSTHEGMILQRMHKLTWNLPHLIKSPLFECYPCMCSIWGSIFWILATQFHFLGNEFPTFTINMIFFILFSGGFNIILSLTILTRFDGL